jgi:hypothetical protein
MKFGALRDGVEHEHVYSDAAEVITYADGTTCLRVTTVGSLTDLMARLGGCLIGDWYFLYVLLISHTEHKPGRYQSPPVECYDGVRVLLAKYKSFLDGDGRHHLWLGSTSGSGLIVYDQHNVLYCYGPIDAYLNALPAFSHSAITIPTPHTHWYPSEFAAIQRQLLEEWDWKWFPLAESDDR